MVYPVHQSEQENIWYKCIMLWNLLYCLLFFIDPKLVQQTFAFDDLSQMYGCLEVLWTYLKSVFFTCPWLEYTICLLLCVNTSKLFFKLFIQVSIWFEDLDYGPSMNLKYFYSFSTAPPSLLIKRVWKKNVFFYSSCCQSELSIFGIFSVVLSDKEVSLLGIELLYS